MPLGRPRRGSSAGVVRRNAAIGGKLERFPAMGVSMAMTYRDERDESRSYLVAATTRRHLPILDNVRVASPCKESWEQMEGDARVRHCARCDQNVYNLSEMTREEAERLILETEGSLCARYFRRRQDGSILTKDCPVTGRRRAWWWFGLGLAAVIAGFVAGIRRTWGPEHAAPRAELSTYEHLDLRDMPLSCMGAIDCRVRDDR